jgi:hypothetical protein
MPLVDELKVTLKDLMPDRLDGVMIQDRESRHMMMTISSRLAAALKDYADARQLSFTSVVEQLRKEIQEAPQKGPADMQ